MKKLWFGMILATFLLLGLASAYNFTSVSNSCYGNGTACFYGSDDSLITGTKGDGSGQFNYTYNFSVPDGYIISEVTSSSLIGTDNTANITIYCNSNILKSFQDNVFLYAEWLPSPQSRWDVQEFGTTLNTTIPQSCVQNNQITLEFDIYYGLAYIHDTTFNYSVVLAGTPQYEITNCTDLQSMIYDLDGDYTLMNHIDCADTINWNAGAGFEPIGTLANQFTGSLTTNGKQISNLYIYRPSTDYVGLFGYFGADAYTNQLMVRGSNITGKDYVGAVFGKSDATISQVAVKDTNSVTGHDYVGGLMGYNAGTIEQSNSKNGLVTGNNNTGGFAGFNNYYIGNSFSHNNVNGNDYVGGFVGFNHGTLYHVYSVGKVNGVGTHKGGLVGGAGSDWESSFWDAEYSEINESIEGYGKTTAEMINPATYEGWDFTTIWQVHSYPEFLWEFPLPPSITSQPIYQVMEGSGAGLGMFLEYLAQSLPLLMIGLVIVGIISVIGYALVNVIRKAMHY